MNKLAIILLDLENIWRGLIRNHEETRKNPVGLSDLFFGIRKIISNLEEREKKVLTFIFLPPHYRNVCGVAGEGTFLWSFCPTYGTGRTRYNSADQNIIRLANLIARPENRETVSSFFGTGPRSYIEAWAEKIFQAGKVPIFWPDESNPSKQKRYKKKILQALNYFFDGKALITDVCLLSGDSDFKQAVERLKKRGINVIISSAPNDSLSLDLLEVADEFWEFPRSPAPH